jgi:tryptophan synthase beta chain
VILFNMSGHGLMDLSGFDSYLQGKLQDHAMPENELKRSLAGIKDMPKPNPVKAPG